jgi:hypothetical protein
MCFGGDDPIRPPPDDKAAQSIADMAPSRNGSRGRRLDDPAHEQRTDGFCRRLDDAESGLVTAGPKA